MSLISSKLKTWLKRNGFKCEGRQPMRSCNGYVERDGRKYRFRELQGVVDIGEPVETFDRWANSTVKTILISEFKEKK